MLVDGESGDEIVGILTNGRTGDSPLLRKLFELAEAQVSVVFTGTGLGGSGI